MAISGDWKNFITVAEAHGAAVFIDEAHSIWPAASTVAAPRKCSASKTVFPLSTGLFRKPLARSADSSPVHGRRSQYLRFYAHPYVYSCALPAVVVAAILKALEIGASQPQLRRQLWENADYFHEQLRRLGIDTGNSTTYMMPLVIGDRERMYRLGHELRSRGLWVAPVDYPAVPQNRICFRACVTALHTRADLDEALNILEDTLVPSLVAQNA